MEICLGTMISGKNVNFYFSIFCNLTILLDLILSWIGLDLTSRFSKTQ